MVKDFNWYVPIYDISKFSTFSFSIISVMITLVQFTEENYQKNGGKYLTFFLCFEEKIMRDNWGQYLTKNWPFFTFIVR